MIEILNIREGQLQGEYIINGLHLCTQLDENYQNVLDWVESGKEVMPKYTTEELILIENMQIEAQKSHFKSLYLNVFYSKLKELDYDGIDTLTMWANKTGSTFQSEAQSVLDWYEAIINHNYAILNSGVIPSDQEYLDGLPKFGVV